MSKHLVAIFGGAVSGAEAANQLTQRGIETVVFDQSALPYGKIEDGLPKWHVKLRDKEEGKINEKLSQPLVNFVPHVGLGRDIDFEDVARNWGFSAVLLATGAWRDRPLPVDGVDDYLNKGFYYQNPFINWFNHYHEPNYSGHTCEIAEGAIVVGGGLASIDVAKALMMLNVKNALAARGIETNILELDIGINKKLDNLGLTFEELGVKPCTLYYRRRIQDMPLAPIATDTPEKLAKAEKLREKILNNAKTKFFFNVAPCQVPVGTIVEDGRLAGLVFQETKIENGKAVAQAGSEKEVRSPLVISSIGSIPEPIKGIPMQWQTYKVNREECCRIEGYTNVFALGNAVTGRGNIIESMKHGRAIASEVAEKHLIEPGEMFEQKVAEKESLVADQMDSIAGQIEKFDAPNEAQKALIKSKVAELQQKVNYGGDFKAWVAEHLPTRLEHLVDH